MTIFLFYELYFATIIGEHYISATFDVYLIKKMRLLKALIFVVCQNAVVLAFSDYEM